MRNNQPIDFVVPWVDDSDPVWRKKKADYSGIKDSEGNTEVRYRDWDNLKYWFRGVEKYAPWVRYVWFVTDDQKPEWLNVDHPKLKWVKHTDFIPEEYLPTFSANPIEWNLHRIEGLAEQFVYFNDDVFLIRDAKPEDFFVDGLPCDLPKVTVIYPSSFFSYMKFNNVVLLNRHFSLKKSICKNWWKWVVHQPPAALLRLMWYGVKKLIPGFVEYHIHTPYRKETFQTLWEQEPEWIHQTCTHRFRTKEDLTTWCVRDWRLLTGDFYPKQPCGKMFSTDQLETNGALKYLRKQKGNVVCLNDNEHEVNFQKHRQMILEAFEEILPEKSSFELY